MAATAGRMNQREFRAFNRLTARRTKDLLASGFLDQQAAGLRDRGSSKGIAFDALQEVLFFYGGELVKEFGKQLDKADANASGKLTDSMRIEITRQGKTAELRIYMNDYAKFVDQGVQGIDSNARAPRSPYKFKFRNPSKAHVEAIEAWIKRKNIRAIVVVPKGMDTGKMKPRSLAYIFAKAAKKRGLRATYFKEKAIASIINDMKADIAKAINVDFSVNIILD